MSGRDFRAELAAYERDYAAWEASKPTTTLITHFRAVGEVFARADVIGNITVILPREYYDLLAAESEHMTRPEPRTVPRSIDAEDGLTIQTACGPITVEWHDY